MQMYFNSNPQVTINKTEIQTLYDYQDKVTHNFDDHSSVDITVATTPIPEMVTLFYSAQQSPGSISPTLFPNQKGQVLVYETTEGYDIDHTIYGEPGTEVPIEFSVAKVGSDLILTVSGTNTSGTTSAMYFKYRISPFNSLEA